LPSGATSAIATGAASNTRRKRSSEFAVAARAPWLARHETRLVAASAATNRPWTSAQRHAAPDWWSKTAPLSQKLITVCCSTTKAIASRYAHHSS
jgi:hypothetical protein